MKKDQRKSSLHLPDRSWALILAWQWLGNKVSDMGQLVPCPTWNIKYDLVMHQNICQLLRTQGYRSHAISPVEQKRMGSRVYKIFKSSFGYLFSISWSKYAVYFYEMWAHWARHYDDTFEGVKLLRSQQCSGHQPGLSAVRVLSHFKTNLCFIAGNEVLTAFGNSIRFFNR